MKVRNLFGQKAEAQPKILRALSAEECRQVTGGRDPFCGTCTTFSTTPKTDNPLPGRYVIDYQYGANGY